MEPAPSDSSEGEETTKKEKYKKQYGEKDAKEEYSSKEKGKLKASKSEKQLDVNEVTENYTDIEEVGLNYYKNAVYVCLPIEKFTQHLG